jgi:hypothetical protein
MTLPSKTLGLSVWYLFAGQKIPSLKNRRQRFLTKGDTRCRDGHVGRRSAIAVAVMIGVDLRTMHDSRICCFAGYGCGVCSAPRGFSPQTADADRTELADGVSKLRNLLELL